MMGNALLSRVAPAILLTFSVVVCCAASTEETATAASANEAVEIVTCTNIKVNGADVETKPEAKQEAAKVCPPAASCPVTTKPDFSKTDYANFVTERV